MDEQDKQLRAIIASQAELVGSITHDLKGLLSGVEGGIYLVNSGLQKDKKERIEQGFEMMQRSLGRIRRTVASVLYYVKDRDIDWQPIDIQDLVASVKDALLEHANHHGVTLKFNGSPGSFEGDQFQIHSLLLNLVEYGIEACTIAKLKPSPSISMEASLSAENILFELIVDGFVMEEGTLEHAMGAHYAPKGVDRSHLGTFVAHRLALRHGGSMQIRSNRDGGTTHFEVELPKKRPANLHEDADEATQDRLADEWEGDLK